MRDKYEPSVLTAAITGGDVLPSQSPAIPCGIDAIVAEAVAAANAGATCVHLHGRERDGRPSGRAELLRAIAEGVREQVDVVLNFSTGGTPGMSERDRLAALAAARPEIATFNVATMNYETFPDRSRWPHVEHDWEREVLEDSGNGLFTNTLAQLRRFGAAFKELGVTPEVEVYDLGHLTTTRFLLDEGTLQGPLRVQLVLGIFGCAPAETADLLHLAQAAERILGDDLGSLGVAAAGYPAQLRLASVGLGLGMDCRVGLEDSLRVTRARRAESNAELVEAASAIAELIGRPIATPAQLRAELGPWSRAATAAA